MQKTLTKPNGKGLRALDNQIDKFVGLLDKSLESMLEAGRLLVSMIDSNPDKDTFERIMERYPNLRSEALAQLERLGRGQIMKEVLLDTSPGARKLLALPLSQQKQIYENGVKVAVERGNKIAVEIKPVPALTIPEASRAFSHVGVRTVPEQAALIRTKKNATVYRPTSWEIVDGKLLVRENTQFSKKELQEILAKLK